MNDEVRAEVAARLKQKDMSRADLARSIKRTPQEISRALNGGARGGSVPLIWADILSALDLELTARPREEQPHEEQTGEGKSQ